MLREGEQGARFDVRDINVEDANTYRRIKGNSKCGIVIGGRLLAGGKEKVFYAIR